MKEKRAAPRGESRYWGFRVCDGEMHIELMTMGGNEAWQECVSMASERLHLGVTEGVNNAMDTEGWFYPLKERTRGELPAGCWRRWSIGKRRQGQTPMRSLPFPPRRTAFLLESPGGIWRRRVWGLRQGRREQARGQLFLAEAQPLRTWISPRETGGTCRWRCRALPVMVQHRNAQRPEAGHCCVDIFEDEARKSEKPQTNGPGIQLCHHTAGRI